jgi:hypothetical protein
VNEGSEGGSPGLFTTVLAIDGEPSLISRRGGRGHRLEGRGAAVSLGGGLGGEGGPEERSEWPVRTAALGSGRRRRPAQAEEIEGAGGGQWCRSSGEATCGGRCGGMLREEAVLGGQGRGGEGAERSGRAFGGCRGKRRDDFSYELTARRGDARGGGYMCYAWSGRCGVRPAL